MPCCKTYNNDLALGNINKSSIQEILEQNKEWLSNLRELINLKMKFAKSAMVNQPLMTPM